MPRRNKLSYFIVLLQLPLSIISFLSKVDAYLPHQRRSLNMEFQFEKGPGSMSQVNAIGTHGEYYFFPAKVPKLIAPPEALGKDLTVAVFQKSTVLIPSADDEMSIHDMRLRQLVEDVGINRPFGLSFFNEAYNKFGLVGTLAMIKRIDRYDDGGSKIYVRGIGRFYIKKLLTDKTYLRAEVQVFQDYSNMKLERLHRIEDVVFAELCYTTALIQCANPKARYKISAPIIKFSRRPIPKDARTVVKKGDKNEIKRMMMLSFCIMRQLKMSGDCKLSLIQMELVENRFQKLYEILVESRKSLENQLRFEDSERFTATEFSTIRRNAILEGRQMIVNADTAGIEKWAPNLDESGDWTMGPNLL